MAEIHITGLSELQGRINRVIQQAPRLAGQVLTRRLTEAVTYARQNYLTGGTTAQRLRVRTGVLRASFGMQVQQRGGEIDARIGYILPQGQRGGAGDPLIYARIHEGWPENRSRTVIRPRSAQYLAIPLEGALTPAGVARGRPRDFPDTFVRRARAGRLVILQRTGSGIVPLFLLTREVSVPARPALRPTMQRFLPLITADLGRVLLEQLGR